MCLPEAGTPSAELFGHARRHTEIPMTRTMAMHVATFWRCPAAGVTILSRASFVANVEQKGGCSRGTALA